MNAKGVKTFRGRDSDPHEKLRIEKRELDDFSELADLFTQPSDLGVGDIARILMRHIVDQWVHLSWEITHDGQCGHIQRHPELILE